MPREDGRFELYYSQGYAVLTVFAPEGGKPVYPEDVVNRMRILRVPRVAESVIQDIIDEASGQPVRLTEWPAGAELSSTLTVVVSDDALTASITMQSPRKGGGLPARSEVLQVLEREGVLHGIDETAIDRLLADRLFDTPVTIARGTEPVHGRPPTPEFTFETDVGKPFLIDGYGRIDLKELNFIQEKHEGDVLARIEPAVAPVDGRDVFGRVITARPAGALRSVRPGDNTSWNDDESEIRALADGNAFVKAGAVHIEPVVVVDSVDYTTGNISYEGSVRVRRGIADGFTVHAGGSLEVGECVGRVSVSADRELLLRGGMNGGNDGTAECGGRIIAKYIESANVTCRGNLLVTDAIMHSNVVVFGNLGLRGRHAEIIGGTGIVGGNLWCRKIGSIAETPTRVSVGVDVEIQLEYARLRDSDESIRDRIDELDRISRHLEARLVSEEEIDPETLGKVRAERESKQRELHEIDARLRELRSTMQASTKTRVVVEEQIYPRTVVVFGREEYRAPSGGTDRTILRWIDGKIIEAGFNADDPPDFAGLIGAVD